ncbi:50S ribosomal protein L9 [bacterium]|nr:50S ribosomal protein L9 [bacterium]
MEVILLDRIQNLGDLGDVVTVKPGYGRNYLLPQGKALRATAANREVYEARKAELLKKAAESTSAAKARAEAIAKLGTVTISSRASEEGKLYGSVGPREVALALTEAGVATDKEEVVMDTPMREVGEADVTVHLYAEVDQDIKVIVQAEETS